MEITDKERKFLEFVDICLNLTSQALVFSFNNEQSRLYKRMTIYLEIKKYCKQGQFDTAIALLHKHKDILMPDNKKDTGAKVNTDSPSTGE